jgi:diguanylate cyclase (GGDEF)-like protein
MVQVFPNRPNLVSGSCLCVKLIICENKWLLVANSLAQNMLSRLRRCEAKPISTVPDMTGSTKLPSLIKIPDILSDTSRARTIIQLRWIVILASCGLVVFTNKPLPAKNIVYAFVVFHISTNVVLYFVRDEIITYFRFFSPLVIFDTLAVSLALIVTGNLGSDLYLTYFLVIIIAAFWQDIRWSLVFAVIISLLYGALLFIADRYETELLLRVPLLFTASLFYGYFAQLVSSERSLREKAEMEARQDFLTGLANRKAFDERMKMEAQRALRYRRPLSLLMVDIDNFKAVNDTLGHEWGDNVLRVVSKILSCSIRQTDFVARYGGEEFAVILPETELENACRLGERLCLAIKENPLDTPQGSLSLTVSIGASSNLATTNNGVALDRDADQALYLAKRRGKDRVECLLSIAP